MGLLFNRKSKFGATIAKKSVLSRDRILASKSGRKELAKSIRKYFKAGKQISSANQIVEDFKGARTGLFKRSEGHEIIKKYIKEGRITKGNAIEFSKALGYTGSANKEYRKFKDMSEYRDFQRKQERLERKEKENTGINNVQRKKPAVVQNNRPKDFPVKTNLNKPIASSSNNKAQLTSKIISSERIFPEKMKNKEDKKNIWDLLNKQQHPNAFPDDHPENQKEAV